MKHETENMKHGSMHRVSSIVILILVLGLTGFLGWLFWNSFFSSSPDRGKNSGGEMNGEAIFRPDDPENQIYQPADGSLGNFVFQYPNKFIVTELPLEGGGKRILVESTEPKKGFEITIFPFDEPAPLTSDRILQDLPEMRLDNSRVVSVGGGIAALAFDSTDETIGNTHEVWFVNGGYLYQALTYPEFGAVMEEILKTWRFK